VLSVFDTGYAETLRKLFPLFPQPGFSPDFSDYDFDNIDWFKTYEAMAQSPSDAIVQVSGTN